MHRREFLIRSASGMGAAWLNSKDLLAALATQPSLSKFSASDTITLGSTGIKTSRLAMGTGTVGFGHHSNQTTLGVKGLSDLLLNGYDQGLRFFDAADSYGSHPHVAEALKHVPRDKVTVLTKTWARDPAAARADLDRFRRELGVDYLDVCLMHCVTEADWTEPLQGRDGRALRSPAEGNYSGPRLFLPQHRGAANRREVAVGGGRSRPHQSHRLAYGRRPSGRGQRSARNESRGQSRDRHEDSWPGRSAGPAVGSSAVCVVAGRARCLHHWS